MGFKDMMETPGGALFVLVMGLIIALVIAWLIWKDQLVNMLASLLVDTIIPGLLIFFGAIIVIWLGFANDESKFVYIGFAILLAGVVIAGVI